jgi:hypothetical protein
MSLISVGGVALPTPSGYKSGIQDLTHSERNARGTMISEFIARKYKIEMVWNFMEADDLSTLLTAIDAQFFSVTYLDQMTNTYKTGTFYKGDRSIPLFDFLSEVPRYKEVGVNFIER